MKTGSPIMDDAAVRARWCSDCGKELNGGGDRCPHCGRRSTTAEVDLLSSWDLFKYWAISLLLPLAGVVVGSYVWVCGRPYSGVAMLAASVFLFAIGLAWLLHVFD